MTDFPRSLFDLQRQFPNDAACAAHLAAQRWPEGFLCPACAHRKAWQLRTKPWTFECAGCRKQTSVTAGTVMHGSKLSLSVWFWAAYLMATHSNGISALQLQRQLGLGSYKTAWLLAHKLRRAMVASERTPLSGVVEVDETTINCRSKDEPPAGGSGRSHRGKLLIAGAVELGEDAGAPRRIRLAQIDDFSAASLHRFLGASLAAGATARTDGWAGYPGAAELAHDPHVVAGMAAHVVLPWVHRVFSNLKTWALGVYHGLRRNHLQAYLDEFVFRFNRRHSRHAAFTRLLRLGLAAQPLTYTMLITPELKG